MQISREWCGFTGGESDTLRKAVGKKKVKLMEELKPKFIKGAVEVGGATEEIAETFWNQLLEFANYCFNKSHAACYALVAYWTAYLKAHYPDAFMAALMTSDMRWTDRLAIEISECKRMGLKVLGPDINQSYSDFSIVGGENTIRFGLAGVKGMGKALIEEIVIPERDENGPFQSVCDFAKRINSTKFNKKSWESAIKTGAFDRFNTRSDLLFNLEAIQGYGNKAQTDSASGQMSLFDMMGEAGEIPEPEIKKSPAEVSEKEQLLWERDLMGLYLSAHPLDKYDTFFEERCHPFSAVCADNEDCEVVIGGIITDVRSLLTHSGKKMAFVKMESKTDNIEVIIFPNVFEKLHEILVVDNVVKLRGRISSKDKNGNITSDTKILVEDGQLITDIMLETYKSTGERLPDPKPVKKKEYKRSRTSAETVKKPAKKTEATKDAPKSEAPADTPKPVIRDARLLKIYILVTEPENTELLTNIRKVCDDNKGFSEVILVLKDENGKRPLRMPFKSDPSEELISGLKNLVGDEAVVVK